MAALWADEREIRGSSPDARRAARQRAAAPVVAALFERWEAEFRRIPGKSKLAEAIRYAQRRRADFERFLDDGRLDIDNDTVERAIRPQTITRKNALFAGSDSGGRTWATIATLLATAKLNGVDPYAWLKITLERIAGGWPNRDIDDLMPWNHRQARTAAPGRLRRYLVRGFWTDDSMLDNCVKSSAGPARDKGYNKLAKMDAGSSGTLYLRMCKGEVVGNGMQIQRT